MSNPLQPQRLYRPGNSPGQNTRVGSFSFLQGIFPTQGSNPGLLHCRWILYQLSHKGSPRILEWVAYPFSSGFPDPGVKLGSPALQADSLPTEPPGKSKNTGVGSLSLLQWIFLTQESNWVSCIAGRFFTRWATRESLWDSNYTYCRMCALGPYFACSL